MSSSGLSQTGTVSILRGPEGFKVMHKCRVQQTSAWCDMHVFPPSVSAEELGADIYTALRDMHARDPQDAVRFHTRLEREYPDWEEWSEIYDSMSVIFRPKLDPKNIRVTSSKAGGDEESTVVLPVSASAAEIGAQVLKQFGSATVSTKRKAKRVRR